MALWVCTGCSCRYAVGVARCPQCGSREYVEEGEEDMAKVTVHGGPSDEYAERGEDVSAGSSSSTSGESKTRTPEPSETTRPSPARTTGNRSKRARTGSSSAAGTDGGQAAGTSATDED